MKIMFVDDHQMVYEGLAALLDKDQTRYDLRTTSDPFAALNLAREFRPDVAVLDVTMPGMNGFDLCRQLLENMNPAPRVLMLSMHSDAEFVAEAMRSGATGYVVKNAAADELLDAIRSVAQGKTFLSPAVAGTLVERYVKNPSQGEIAPRYTLLSSRERQTLQLLAEGLSVKEIAFKLDLSDKTVHTFRRNLMDKLGFDSIAELTKYAVRHGLTSAE